MSIEPWNTAADGNAGCEDMPRKSIDIRLTDYPVVTEKGQLRPFPAFRRGRARAEPENGSRGAEHPGDVRFAPTETECRSGPLRVLRAAP